MHEINEKGIMLLDVFMLDYCGIKVFFQVCKTTKKSVFLVELGIKKYKNGITLLKGFKPSKNPYIITINNTQTKSTYEVFPEKIDDNEYWLPIEIKMGSKIYIKAITKNREYPPIGTAYAVPIKEYANKYWENSTEIEKEEKINWD